MNTKEEYKSQLYLSKKWNIPEVTFIYWRKHGGAMINGVFFPLRSQRSGKLVYINMEDFMYFPTWFRKGYKTRKFKSLIKI